MNGMLQCECGSGALRITRGTYDGPRTREVYRCETCGATGTFTHDDVSGSTLTGCLE